MASNYWIKLYHETLDDPKMGRLTDRQYRRVIELFLLAGDYEHDGLLPSLKDITFRLRSPEGLEEDLEVLQEIGILSINDQDRYYITRWEERQGPMSNQERQARFRDSKRKLNYYGNKDVTTCNTDKEEDIEEDIDKDEPQNFTNKFISTVRVAFTNSKQPHKLDDLVEDYGEDLILEVAQWCQDKKMTSMGNVLSAMEGALKGGWNTKPKGKLTVMMDTLEGMKDE